MTDNRSSLEDFPVVERLTGLPPDDFRAALDSLAVLGRSRPAIQRAMNEAIAALKDLNRQQQEK